MTVRKVIYALAALIILYLLFDKESFGVERIKQSIGGLARGFRAVWNPLIGKGDGNS